MKVIDNKIIFSFDGSNSYVEKVKDNETVVFITRDCFNDQLTEEGTTIGTLDWNCINPATGPVYVEGATTNDTLKVEILKIELGDTGVMCALPGAGLLGPKVKEESIKRIKVKDGKVYFNDDITFDVTPMVGVIGVAPKEGSISNGSPGVHGGNMDNKRIKEGATVYFPIFHEGALFSLGDIHAAMGDGEIMVSGVEINAKVTVKISVLKDVQIETPIVENDEIIGVVYSDKEIEKAIYNAVDITNEIVSDKLGISYNEAGMLLSAVGDVQICQVVNPEKTVMMSVPKSILKSVI